MVYASKSIGGSETIRVRSESVTSQILDGDANERTLRGTYIEHQLIRAQAWPGGENLTRGIGDRAGLVSHGMIAKA